MDKRKKTQNNEQVKLRSVTLTRTNDGQDRVYFFLSIFVLILTCLIIIGGCFGILYLFYRQMMVSKEAYF